MCCSTITSIEMKFLWLQVDLELDLLKCYDASSWNIPASDTLNVIRANANNARQFQKMEQIFQRWLEKAWELFLDPKDHPPEVWRCVSIKECEDCGGNRIEERGHFVCEECGDVGRQVLRSKPFRSIYSKTYPTI
jgi:hypothetical protein